jgi:hypothetical protein
MDNNIIPTVMLAGELQPRNRIHMQLGAPQTAYATSRMTHYFPIDAIQYEGSRVVCSIHGTSFKFDANQFVEVHPASLTRDQVHAKVGLGAITRTEQSREDGKPTRHYTVEGHEEQIVLQRDSQLKVFNVVSWPSWMPALDHQRRHAIEFASNWTRVERVVSAITGSPLTSGKYTFTESPDSVNRYENLRLTRGKKKSMSQQAALEAEMLLDG